ncbi:ARM repeat-containing protein [Thelephora ganbajun]|uniref:ARM repeat-containing protein n=1 Tax=Thelephora ganbajun TaxID=370292 RepID=A0ACB6ZS40_THEGA|nr:ARM repeat-containing protein [Thelephora ganbajun]
MVAQTRAGGQPSPQKLKFHEKLLGRTTTSTDVLLKKLKALHTELAELEQDRLDKHALDGVRQELIHQSILLHKDKGVKAYAACCIADTLRLTAPRAPYTQNELTDIFHFFLRQLVQNLKSSDTPYYNQYFLLLECLSAVKSTVLICDLPKSDELIEQFFKDCFKIVRYDLSKKIELFMVDILNAIIDESHTIPSVVVTTLLAQFMDKNLGMDQPAFRLATQVCNGSSTKLQRYVCQYFTDIILQHSDEEEFEEIQKAHDLVKRLNRFCPSLLHNVVPQLEEELRVDEVSIRIMATQALGEMFADSGGTDFMRKYPSTWNLWLTRRNDKAAAVRLAFVEACKGLVIAPGDTREAIEDALSAKLLDPDEKVRAAVCRLYSQLEYEVALHHVSESQWRAIAERGLDKKVTVRTEALNCIGKAYSLAYPELEVNDPAAVQQFSWIPGTILSKTPPEVRLIAEQVLADYIFPLQLSGSKTTDVNEVGWTERLLHTMKFLDEKATQHLINLSGLKTARPGPYEAFLDACKANNGGVIDSNEEEIVKKLDFSIKILAAQLPDSQKAAEDLAAFAKLNEGRLYSLFKTCTDVQTDLKTLVKSTAEFTRRVEQASSTISSTMTVLMRRASLRLINQSSVPTLIKHVRNGDFGEQSQSQSSTDMSAKNASIILTCISKYCPAMFRSHVPELVKSVADEKHNQLAEVSLHALSALLQWDPSLTPTDKRFVDRIRRFCLGSDRKRTKYSARLLCYMKDKEDLREEVVEAISDDLSDVDSEKLLAHVTALVEFSRRAPDCFEQYSDTVIAFLVKHVLLVSTVEDQDEMDVDGDWKEDSRISDTLRTKILSLKLCRHRCIAQAKSENPMEIASPVFKMLTTLLQHDGLLSDKITTSPSERSRLRLQAAVSMTYLSAIDTYAQVTTPHFVLLALTIQDTCFHVRSRFLTKIIQLLHTRVLPFRFNIIHFLTVFDPDEEIKNIASAYIMATLQRLGPRLRLQQFEMAFPRLLHLLAHHPDFAVTHESAVEMSKYIKFYITTVAAADNISLIFHLAEKVKTVRDAESDQYSEHVYALSDLSQRMIQSYAKSRSWTLTNIPTGKTKLPSDVFHPLPDAATANKILRTRYLPEETYQWLEEQGKVTKPEPKEKAEGRNPRKRKAKTEANGTTK